METLLAAPADSTLDLESDLDLSGCERLWILQPTPTHDAALTRELRKRAVPHYSPMGTRRVHDGKQWQYRPTRLLPGYVVTLADEFTPFRVRDESPYCLGLIRVFDQDRLLSDLRNVDRLVRSGLPVAAEESFAIGQSVRVLSGPFEGAEGTVIECKSGRRLVVDVAFLGRRVSATFDDWRIEAVGC